LTTGPWTIGILLFLWPMKNILLTFVLLGLAFTMSSQTVDFHKLHLKVRFDTISAEVHGDLTLSFTAASNHDSIYLNGIRMTYQEVLLNGEAANYQNDEKGLWLFPAKLNDTNEIRIDYSCQPRKGIYFIGWQDKTGRAPRQIWTQGQGIDHRHWIPHRDDQTDKVIVELDVDFAENYQMMANGKLHHKNSTEGITTWHFRMTKPMSSYLIALAIGKYDTITTSSNESIPLYQYYYADRADDYNWYYHENEEIFNFLCSEIGVPYPWQNYKQAPVQDFRHGAMENTTATIFGDFFLVDSIAFNDENYTYVNAHELAHQWFGNLVTATGSDEHWLHEGFATYYQWLSEKNLYGWDRYDWDRYQAALRVREASAMDTIPLGNGEAGSSRFYQKGGWVLHMLRAELGDSLYREVMMHYLQSYAFGLVTTDSLNQSIKEVSDIDYSDFFERWVHTAGEPVMEISSQRINDKVKLEIRNSYRPAPSIHLRIPVMLQKAGGAVKQYLDVPTVDTTIYLDLPGDKTNYWVINPDMEKLVFISEKRETGEWINMFPFLTNLLDRHQALVSINDAEIKEKAKFLRQVVTDHAEHFALRGEALRQLIVAKDAKAKRLLKGALTDEDVQLQKEAIKLIPREWRKEFRPEILNLLKGNSYELRSNAVHLAIDLENQEKNDWLFDSEFEKCPGIPGNQVLVPVLFYRYYLLEDDKAMEQLIDMTGNSYDFLTRMNSIAALANTGLIDNAYLLNLFDALFDPNWKLSSAARGELRRLYQMEEGKKLIENIIDEYQDNWEDFQNRRVRRTFELN
jgi:hypothetical protein